MISTQNRESAVSGRSAVSNNISFLSSSSLVFLAVLLRPHAHFLPMSSRIYLCSDHLLTCLLTALLFHFKVSLCVPQSLIEVSRFVACSAPHLVTGIISFRGYHPKVYSPSTLYSIFLFYFMLFLSFILFAYVTEDLQGQQILMGSSSE